jgi:NADPH:quinone reductase-like Zn-dependent oxidoreductase
MASRGLRLAIGCKRSNDTCIVQRLLISLRTRLFQGVLPPESAAFQQYALVPSGFVIQIPSNLSFDEAASMPLGIATSFLGLYGPRSDKPGGGAALTPFYEEGGRGKYNGKPMVVLGGATSMGQYGNYHSFILPSLVVECILVN